HSASPMRSGIAFASMREVYVARAAGPTAFSREFWYKRAGAGAIQLAPGPQEAPPMPALADLETPAVTVHLDVMEVNIRRVQAHLDQHRIANRPHIKTHKIPAIGKMQMAAGAGALDRTKPRAGGRFHAR